MFGVLVSTSRRSLPLSGCFCFFICLFVYLFTVPFTYLLYLFIYHYLSAVLLLLLLWFKELQRRDATPLILGAADPRMHRSPRVQVYINIIKRKLFLNAIVLCWLHPEKASCCLDKQNGETWGGSLCFIYMCCYKLFCQYHILLLFTVAHFRCWSSRTRTETSSVNKPLYILKEIYFQLIFLTQDTDAIILYKSMRDTLVYLTHLDPVDTQEMMLDKLQKQVSNLVLNCM